MSGIVIITLYVLIHLIYITILLGMKLPAFYKWNKDRLSDLQEITQLVFGAIKI